MYLLNCIIVLNFAAALFISLTKIKTIDVTVLGIIIIIVVLYADNPDHHVLLVDDGTVVVVVGDYYY